MDVDQDTKIPAKEGDSWGPDLINEETQDPEELRVLYSAVESFS